MDITPITLREAAELHAQDLTGLKDLADGTIRNYKSTYNTIRRHLEETLHRDPLSTDLTTENVEGYFRDYVAVHAKASYGQKRSALTGVITWLMKKKHMPYGENAAAELPKRRQTKKHRDRWLSDSEVLRLLKVAKASHLRDYFLVLFARLTGRRIGEIIGGRDGQQPLIWGDIRWEEDCIEWDNFKGRKLSNTMPLTPRLRAVLEAWKAAYSRELCVDEPHPSWILFPALTPAGEARKGRTRRRVISPKSRLTNPDKIMHPLLVESGLWRERGDSWHLLRKSFAAQRKRSASAQNRGDAWELTQIALDHEDMKTTRIYVPVREEYERYAAWAMSTAELDGSTMAQIPELAALADQALAAPAPDTTKEPATTEVDAGQGQQVYTPDQKMADVIPLTSRRRQAALG